MIQTKLKTKAHVIAEKNYPGINIYVLCAKLKLYAELSLQFSPQRWQEQQQRFTCITRSISDIYFVEM